LNIDNADACDVRLVEGVMIIAFWWIPAQFQFLNKTKMMASIIRFYLNLVDLHYSNDYGWNEMDDDDDSTV
jgi:hypothetical protein